MTKISKRQKVINEKVKLGQIYKLEDAINLLKACMLNSFDETVELVVKLGIDPRISEQQVRGSSVLPHGTGRTVRVAVFAQGKNAEAATAAGADRVGFEDLVEEIKSGKIDFDLLIATPDTMRVVGTLGQILGPKGLMPNPKVGTVTQNVSEAVTRAKSGQVFYRSEKAGIVHTSIGKISFEPLALMENLRALLTDLKKSKPASTKGVYLRKMFLTTTMGPGLALDMASLEA